MEFNKFNPWTDKSKGINYTSTKRGVGNGENKIAKEIDATSAPKGQNSTIDLTHPILGNISVKDMTNDNCILGVDGCEELRKIFIEIIDPFIVWCRDYINKEPFVKALFKRLGESKGTSRISIIKGIRKFELSSSNLTELNKIFECLKKINKYYNCESLRDKSIKNVLKALGNKTLFDKCNDVARTEAIKKTLIIVHKEKGWFIVKDLELITCPRITRGAPRINVNSAKD